MLPAIRARLHEASAGVSGADMMRRTDCWIDAERVGTLIGHGALTVRHLLLICRALDVPAAEVLAAAAAEVRESETQMAQEQTLPWHSVQLVLVAMVRDPHRMYSRPDLAELLDMPDRTILRAVDHAGTLGLTRSRMEKHAERAPGDTMRAARRLVTLTDQGRDLGAKLSANPPTRLREALEQLGLDARVPIVTDAESSAPSVPVNATE
ncbi:hypothetical protein [Kutzneria viridogrisea]